MGNPPPKDLARVIASGITSKCSNANILPVRPMPVWTSSMIRTAPASSQSSLTRRIYSLSATWIPPSPWIGSRRTAAVSVVTARSIADTSLKGTYLNPGTRGSKSFWYLGCPVAVREPKVLPWKDSRAVTISYFADPCFALANFLASLIAASLASVPLLQKNALPNGVP